MNNKSVIFTRRSIRAYDSSKKVSKEQLEDLLKAAMYAPSAMDKRPWEFLVISEPEAIEKALAIQPYSAFLKDAGSAIIVCGNLDKEFKTPSGTYRAYDCSAAAQNILLRAKEIGLGTCWCGIAPDKAGIEAFRKSFNIPENIEPIAMIVVGIPAENPETNDRFDSSKVNWQMWNL